MRAEYRVACGSELETLIQEVNSWLAQGFSLAGSMQIEPSGDPDIVTWFYQPMFRPAGYHPLKTED